MQLLEWALALCGLPLFLAASYLGVLALLARRTRTQSGFADPRTRFDVVVPAHDEASGIARTVKNLLALDYPASLRRIIVIADNCTDDTAERARAAGALVRVREDAAFRGKGYALRFAFDESLKDGAADAMVVVDADTVVSENLLRSFDAHIRRGAQAVQAEYGVLNADASWRTSLMRLAFALFHDVRSSARERLKVSTGLRGNGMCFTRELLSAHPHDAFSVVEDLEYGVRLALAGIRVVYAGDAHVKGEMPSSEQGSRTQRRRWEGGRFGVARAHAGTLLFRGLTERSALLLDVAADVLVPPLSMLVMGCVAGLVTSGAFIYLFGHGALPFGLFAVSALFLLLYVLRGWQFSDLGFRGLSLFVRVPGYVLWKLALAFRKPEAPRGEWVRTAREHVPEIH